MLYVVERNNDTYITEDQVVASKLSKILMPIGIKEISLGDVIAYFKIQIPEENITLTPHPTFSSAVKVSDASSLENYLNTAKEMLQLDGFNPNRVQWDEQRESNKRTLDARIKKSQ